MSLTTDPKHPQLGYGADNQKVPQNPVYLVLSEEELVKGYIKPFRNSYKHLTCKKDTIMDDTISATYARDPWFYGSTYCVHCSMHRPLSEFTWIPDGESMDPRLWSIEERRRISILKQGEKENV